MEKGIMYQIGVFGEPWYCVSDGLDDLMLKNCNSIAITIELP